jgi:hypothetical protein
MILTYSIILFIFVIIHEYFSWKWIKVFGYKIFSLFIFLGLELKFFLKLYLGEKIIEPIGAFNTDDPLQIRSLFISLIVFRLMLIVSMLIFKQLKMPVIIHSEYAKIQTSPFWFYIAAGFCVVVQCLNIYFKIFQVGLASMVELVWPFSFIMPFLISTCSIVIVMWSYDFITHKKLIHFLTIVGLASLVAISIGSRSSYIILTLPLFLVAFKRKSWVSFIVIGLAFLITLSLTQYRRDIIYTKYVYKDNDPIKTYNVDRTAKLAISLMSDRWLGLEGAMTAVSYQEKDSQSQPIFIRMLKEKPIVYGSTLYDVISNSSYLTYKIKNQFHSLPGILGFLLFSKSYVVLCVAGLSLIIIGLCIQYIFAFFTSSNLVGVFFSCLYFYNLTQFGVYPVNFLKQITLWILLVICMKFSCIYLSRFKKIGSDVIE